MSRANRLLLLPFLVVFVVVLWMFTAPAALEPAISTDYPATIQITDNDEPGEPLRITGTVYDIKTSKQVAGAHIHVYHTDIHGYYSPNGENEREHRLNGDMTSDGDGRYEFKTIRPGPYPGNTIPAHIHYVVNLPDASEQTFELLFEGDPRITARQKDRAKRKGDFFAIRKLEKVKGVWVGEYDLYVKR